MKSNNKIDYVKIRGIIGLAMAIIIIIFMKIIITYNLFSENRGLIVLIFFAISMPSVVLFIRYALEQDKKNKF